MESRKYYINHVIIIIIIIIIKTFKCIECIKLLFKHNSSNMYFFQLQIKKNPKQI